MSFQRLLDPFKSLARLWLRLWRAVRFWMYLHYSWHLAWHKAERS